MQATHAAPPGRASRQLHAALAAPAGSAARQGLTSAVLVVTAALVATSAGIHLHLWATGYRTIPTIGSLFLFQGVAGAVLAIALALSRRLVAVAAAGGFMLATIGGFLISVYAGLFGFSDTFAAPLATISLAVEAAGVVAAAAGGLLLLARR